MHSDIFPESFIVLGGISWYNVDYKRSRTALGPLVGFPRASSTSLSALTPEQPHSCFPTARKVGDIIPTPSIAIKVNAIGFVKYTTTKSCRTFTPQSYARGLPVKPVSNPVSGV
jgi:hypothetical protein